MQDTPEIADAMTGLAASTLEHDARKGCNENGMELNTKFPHVGGLGLPIL